MILAKKLELIAIKFLTQRLEVTLVIQKKLRPLQINRINRQKLRCSNKKKRTKKEKRLTNLDMEALPRSTFQS